MYKAELKVDINIIQLSSEVGNFIKRGECFFNILKEIRLELEKNNAFLLINGSRQDVYPSSMSSSGFMAYIQKIGKQTSLKDLINIFDDCSDLNCISTVEEQELFHHQWFESLGR